MIQRLLLILFFFATVSNCFAQAFEEKNFHRYTVKQGLSNNYISGIEEDSYGYMWIGTNRGLNRFDGSNFKQFLHTAEKNSLPDNAIFSIEMLPNDQLAVATDDGAQIISTKTLERKNLDIPTEEGLRYWSHSVRYVSADRDGNYIVSTKTGFYIFSPDGHLKKRYDHYTTKDIGHEWMLFGSHLFQLPDGNIMQENRLGLYIYDKKENRIGEAQNYFPGLRQILAQVKEKHDILVFVSTYEILFINTVTNSFDLIDVRTGYAKSFPANLNLLAEIGWQTKPIRLKGNTWVVNSKNKGFFLLQIDTLNKTINLSSQKYFTDHFCNIIFYDSHHRLWVGTTDGVFMEDSHPQTVGSFPVESKNENNNFSITALFADDKKIFAGTDKSEIMIIDRQTKKTIRQITLGKEVGLPKVIISFFPKHRDTLWMATSFELYWLNTNNFSYGILFPGIINGCFPRLFRSKENKIWIGVNSVNKVYIYDEATRRFDSLNSKNSPLLKINLANSFAEDARGNIWIGGDAVARWNNRSKKIDSLLEYMPTQKNRKKGFVAMNDSKGAVWIATNDDGVIKITGSNAPLHLTPENFLGDYRAAAYPGMLSDKICMATINGVGYLHSNNGKAIIFNDDDGIPQHSVTSYHFFEDVPARSVLFASKNIICNIPLSATDLYTKAPRLIINEVTIINDTVINYPANDIRLKYYQNDISLSLSAINFTDPENMRFAYRIKNEKDSAWIDAGKQPNILLTNVSPGNYKLEFKVYAYDNKWPEQTKEIEIIIRPPFWKTWWFFTLVVLLLVTGVYIFYKNRIDEIQKKARIDKQMAEYEIKALHAQMNPHFIFNCLNSIREMILNNENQQASHYLSKFAHLIRITLNNSSKPFISLQNTIDYLQRYLEMERIRTTNFSYNIKTDEAIRPADIFLPPMLIQPFIENAIWHGASLQKEPIKINIHFIHKDNQLLCIIEDNGIGIETSLKKKKEQGEIQPEHYSLGITNVKQRIRVLNEKYNLHSSITIEDKNNLPGHIETGTLVTIYLPVKNTEL
jgi:ligand-binding sensor domain-containing protein